MINVGREFEMDKTRWKSYTEDYFIAMATAAFPWIFVALYYMFVLLPRDLLVEWRSLEGKPVAEPVRGAYLRRHSRLRCLAAAGLKASWVYKKGAGIWRSSTTSIRSC